MAKNGNGNNGNGNRYRNRQIMAVMYESPDFMKKLRKELVVRFPGDGFVYHSVGEPRDLAPAMAHFLDPKYSFNHRDKPEVVYRYGTFVADPECNLDMVSLGDVVDSLKTDGAGSFRILFYSYPMAA